MNTSYPKTVYNCLSEASFLSLSINPVFPTNCTHYPINLRNVNIYPTPNYKPDLILHRQNDKQKNNYNRYDENKKLDTDFIVRDYYNHYLHLAPDLINPFRIYFNNPNNTSITIQDVLKAKHKLDRNLVISPKNNRQIRVQRRNI